VLEFLRVCFQFLAMSGSGEDTVKPYPLVEDLVEPAVRVRMPRTPRVVAPGGTIHVVARCNNRECYFTTAEDFDLPRAPSADPQAEARDPRWTMQRAVGSPFFAATFVTFKVPRGPIAGRGRLPAGPSPGRRPGSRLRLPAAPRRRPAGVRGNDSSLDRRVNHVRLCGQATLAAKVGFFPGTAPGGARRAADRAGASPPDAAQATVLPGSEVGRPDSPRMESDGAARSLGRGSRD
jgi:hypothetical protein